MRLDRACLKISLVMVSVLPLLVLHGFLDPHVFARTILLKAVACLSSVALVWFWIVEPRSRPKSSPILLFGLAYAVAVGVSALVGVDPYYSLTSSAERSGGVVTLWSLGVIYLAIYSLLMAGEDVRRLWSLQVTVGLAVSALAVAYLYAGKALTGETGSQIYGTLANPAFLAEYLLTLSFLAIAAAVSSARRAERFAFALAAALFASLTVWTGIRGAALGLAVGTATLVFAERRSVAGALRRGGIARRPAALAVSLVACLVLVAVGTVGGYDKFASALHGLDSSAAQRLVVWRVAPAAFAARPIFGWGMENFFAAFYAHTPTDLARYTSEVFDRAHNEAVEELVTGGIVGSLLALALIVAVVLGVTNVRRRTPGSPAARQAAVLGAGLVAYGVSMMFVFETEAALVLAVMAIAAIDRSAYGESGTHAVGRPGALTLSSVTGLASVCLCVAVILPATASFLAKRATIGFVDDPGVSVVLYRRALALHTQLDKEIAKDLALRLMAYDPISGGAAWSEGADIAEKTLTTVAEKRDWDPAPLMVLDALYEARAKADPGYLKLAESALERALERSPRSPEVYYKLALVRVKLWDGEGAVRAIDDVARIIPDEPNIMKYRGLLAGLSGDRAGSASAFDAYLKGMGPAYGPTVEGYGAELERVPIMHAVPDL